MSNYNEVLDSEKRALSALVENSLYPQDTATSEKSHDKAEVILQTLNENPELYRQILQSLLAGATNAR